jgi:hypothetical protein
VQPETAMELDDKVLDAVIDERKVKFSVSPKP